MGVNIYFDYYLVSFYINWYRIIESRKYTMNNRENMIILKGEIKTSKVRYCQYNADTKKMDVGFINGGIYSYSYENVEHLKKPQFLNPDMYKISTNEYDFSDYIEAIYVFKGAHATYWHLCFGKNIERDYMEDELNIVKSCLDDNQAENTLQYLKKIASLNNLSNEDTGEKILVKKYGKLNFVREDVALAKYLNPSLVLSDNRKRDYIPIFPFGCNNSQYKAVKSAMEHQISVIQGPPGTGKTQTILNIIANILIQGKTVQVVSNNNSATENVYEKLSSSNSNLGFLVASLGNLDNKQRFIDEQDGRYPDFSLWKLNENRSILKKDIKEKSIQLKEVFDKQEQLAHLKQEYSQFLIEHEYFNAYVQESDVDTNRIKSKKKFSARQWISLWQEFQMIFEEKQKIGFLFKLKGILQCGIRNLSLYKQDVVKIITTFQSMYYRVRKKELEEKIAEIENYLQSIDKGLLDDLCKQSMAILKDKLAGKYENKETREKFDKDDLWKNSDKVLEEYPVILSTTFSSTSSLKVVYDYVIMDEASQVDIVTGALALSCAKNAVIVGDTKQLPNVVTEDVKGQAQEIFTDFHMSEGYQYTKSFLQSVLDVMPNIEKTLLREHYRCHPKIINFCNQKFYRDELIIMTEDKGEEDVLVVKKTAPGNHARNRYSQRQIDVIRDEVIPRYVTDAKGTGIISPYKNQAKALAKEFKDIEAATVHKFQGREKDTIIISTVDDEITDFADDPYLINVAVSRAKKKLMLVVTGNKQVKERNITDLIDYIQYSNFEVTDSKIYSIFDYLYKQYAEERKRYLQKHKRISDYDSENLMYSLIEDILSMDKYASFDVVCHFHMNKLIKNLDYLNEREREYVKNPATHIDFLIYNRISKKVILAIEVDGYAYHREDTVQASRDLLKNHILDMYELPLLRFKTNGSGEKEKIIKKLDEIIDSGWEGTFDIV